jgi:hypothetical protein
MIMKTLEYVVVATDLRLLIISSKDSCFFSHLERLWRACTLLGIER